VDHQNYPAALAQIQIQKYYDFIFVKKAALEFAALNIYEFFSLNLLFSA
jgi:hypothetical protein